MGLAAVLRRGIFQSCGPGMGSGQLAEACACASTRCWAPVPRLRRWGRRGGVVAGWLPSVHLAIEFGRQAVLRCSCTPCGQSRAGAD